MAFPEGCPALPVFLCYCFLQYQSGSLSSSVSFWETKQSHSGLDPESTEGVGWQPCCSSQKTASFWGRCVQVHCHDAISSFVGSTTPVFTLHIFFQTPQHITIKVRIHHNTRWIKFSVNNAFDGKEHYEHTFCATSDLPCLLFSWWLWALPLWWLLFCLWIIVLKPT